MGWPSTRPVGLTHHDRARSCKGYTLVTPSGFGETLLLDMDGAVVHRWPFPDTRPFYARLLDNGNLLALATARDARPPRFEVGDDSPPIPDRFRLMGGGATHLLELDWDGAEVWRYENPGIHHDFVRRANGHTLALEWVEVPPDVARAVRGGARRPREKLPPMISDDIIEIDPQGQIVDRTHIWQFLDPRRDPLCPLETRWEWTHCNSLDVTRDDHLLFSARQNSRVGIIDPDAGELTWKYGAPDVFHQHHASALRNGHVLIFDNGMHRLADMSYSRLVEVDPASNAVAWEYVAQPREQFFSAHISGAERQSNGNTLVCEGAAGRLFEITSRGEVVWEWISPFQGRLRDRDITWIFRVHRYAEDHPALAPHDLDPGRHAAFNRLHGLNGA